MGRVSRTVEDTNRRMLRARDAMDRAYAQPLDVPALARIAHVSPAHFTRTFRATFGETPHRYLQRRRVERAMFLLRETDRSVTDICLRGGLRQPGNLQPYVPRHRRPLAADVPPGSGGHGRTDVLHDGVDAAERLNRPVTPSLPHVPSAEQFWISFRGPGRLA